MNKQDIWGLEFIESLNPAKYSYVSNIQDIVDFRGDPSLEYFGVMAQDISEYIKNQGEDPERFNILNKYNGYYQVNYIELIGPMIKSIQELNKKIKYLEERLND